MAPLERLNKSQIFIMKFTTHIYNSIETSLKEVYDLFLMMLLSNKNFLTDIDKNC